MRTTALLLLLLASAAPTREAVAEVDGGTTRSPSADAPAERKDPDEHWTASLRASVLRQCRASLPDENICSCFTHELEALSGDSDVVTADNMQTALERCREL